jgi:hypothetical protein
MKKYDDYLIGETRESYVSRRFRENNIVIGRLFWHSISTYGGRNVIIQGTLAKPGTQEYKRFLKEPQYPKHIENIHKVYDNE